MRAPGALARHLSSSLLVVRSHSGGTSRRSVDKGRRSRACDACCVPETYILRTIADGSCKTSRVAPSGTVAPELRELVEEQHPVVRQCSRMYLGSALLPVPVVESVFGRIDRVVVLNARHLDP
jgi:hypothetical protein